MINTSYIHENDFIDACNREYEENAREIDAIMGEYYIESARFHDMKSLGIFMESNEEYFEESVTGAVTALGQKILDILAKLKNICKDALDKIMGKSSTQKELDNKIAKLRKEDPELADKLTIKLSQSDFKFNDVKDLNEYYKNMDELIDQLKKEKVDPKSIQGKFLKIKTSLEKNANAIKTATIIIGSAVTVGGFMLKIKDSKKSTETVYHQQKEITAKCALTEAKTKETLEYLEGLERKGDRTATTRIGLLAQISNHMMKTTQANTGTRAKLYNKMLNVSANVAEKAVSTVDKHSKDPNAANIRKGKALTDMIGTARKEYNDAIKRTQTSGNISKRLMPYSDNRNVSETGNHHNS